MAAGGSCGRRLRATVCADRRTDGGAATPIDQWQPSPTRDPLSYPGRIPDYSFVVADSGVHLVETERQVVPLLTGADPLASRTAVLAVGSNAAPARLEEKRDGRPVPVFRARVRDHSAVFSAHVSRYGAIAATLVRDPGAECHLHVTMLDAGQLDEVDRSEGNYARAAVDPGAVEVGVTEVGPVERYASRLGPLLVDGAPVRLAEIPGASPTLGARTQAEMQRFIAPKVQAKSRGLHHESIAPTLADMVLGRGIPAAHLTAVIGRMFA
jgi:hypothetical protein